jgi:hypothetical protein
MSPKRMNTLTLILPVISLAVSGFIVSHEYARGERLRKEIADGERQIERLSRQPGASGPPGDGHHAHDGHDHHDH